MNSATPVIRRSRQPRHGRDGGPTRRYGATAGVHPERVVAGADPERGLVLAGIMTACRPAGGGWEASCSPRHHRSSAGCRTSQEPSVTTFSITALDPPYFGADGAALRDRHWSRLGRSSPTLVPEP